MRVGQSPVWTGGAPMPERRSAPEIRSMVLSGSVRKSRGMKAGTRTPYEPGSHPWTVTPRTGTATGARSVLPCSRPNMT